MESPATESFESFYRAERRRLTGALVLMTGSTHEAEELAQEAFFKVWQRWDHVGAMTDRSGYLFRTALNARRSAYRRALRAAKRVVARPPEEDPFVTIAARDAVLSALAAMTPRERAVIVLTELQGYNTNEVGAMLGIVPGTVRALASRARARLSNEGESEDE